MQPETNKSGRSGGKFSGLGLLLIAIVSGLVVKVVGDPLVEVISPSIKQAARDAGEFLDEQRWDRQWNRQWRRWSEQWERRQDSDSE